MTRTAQPRHEDPGLQPERTVLSWGRTMLALCTAAAIFLRWLPTHGPFVLTLFGVATCTAIGIYSTQRSRYRRGSAGISNEHVTPDAVAVVVTSTAVLALGVLGLITVVVF
ncbi:DUF202 domain-containing protein [Kocuria sp.]|uniref:DUF202 domain-containing protein n=1 Tax=Kocuria sp. TaxID=1871328 RepID=UPI0026E0B46C|nr:DUF202 domain-containing protein [Kocuria sp.]MDO5368277.1 DUF202 domain-containing protein [Kocuria sp.]